MTVDLALVDDTLFFYIQPSPEVRAHTRNTSGRTESHLNPMTQPTDDNSVQWAGINATRARAFTRTHTRNAPSYSSFHACVSDHLPIDSVDNTAIDQINTIHESGRETYTTDGNVRVDRCSVSTKQRW